jgi:hypothetical protein
VIPAAKTTEKVAADVRACGSAFAWHLVAIPPALANNQHGKHNEKRKAQRDKGGIGGSRIRSGGEAEK